jgi:hypothetical protein
MEAPEHFEQLWEKSESLFANDQSPHSSILTEIRMKIALYEAIETNGNIPPQDKHKLKSVAFGAILSTLTHLSQRDNINTYEALSLTMN